MSPNDQITIICGDFNVEVGKRSPDDTCVGSHTTDRVDRMELGEQLVDFCERHGLFLCNTAFEQSNRAKTTHISTTKNNEQLHRTIGRSITFYAPGS